jgi:hypothetical protein
MRQLKAVQAFEERMRVKFEATMPGASSGTICHRLT